MPEATVRAASNFNAEEDAGNLRKAMKGLGTNEKAIIDILTHRSNSQRQLIAQSFNQLFNRDLIKDLKSELGGKFEDLILGLMALPVEYMAKELNRAMAGIGTNESTLIEIICSNNKRDVKTLSETYERLFKRPLAEHICSETGGDFRRFMTLLVTGVRDDYNMDPAKARADAEALFKAGEGKWGTDESEFNRIFTHSSYGQLKSIFKEYKEVSGGKSIEEAIRKEFSGEMCEGLLAIVECVQDKPLYFARKLHKAMDGIGTDDSTLIRIVVSRSEVDLGNIKKIFEKVYNKTLESAIKSETSGDYKSALIELLGPRN